MKLGQRIRTEVNGTVQTVTIVGRTFDDDGGCTGTIVETAGLQRHTIPYGGKGAHGAMPGFPNAEDRKKLISRCVCGAGFDSPDKLFSHFKEKGTGS